MIVKNIKNKTKEGSCFEMYRIFRFHMPRSSYVDVSIWYEILHPHCELRGNCHRQMRKAMWLTNQSQQFIVSQGETKNSAQGTQLFIATWIPSSIEQQKKLKMRLWNFEIRDWWGCFFPSIQRRTNSFKLCGLKILTSGLQNKTVSNKRLISTYFLKIILNLLHSPAISQKIKIQYKTKQKNPPIL